jgi:putative chitinase
MPLITAQTLISALPRCSNPAEWAAALNPALEKYEINTVARISSFLAQTGHESEQFNHLVETALRLMRVWPKRFPTEASAAPYVKAPTALANLVYANRLGNGPTASGDGFRFRGRGVLQLTGRSNYAEASKVLGVDLVAAPDRLIEPKLAALSAAWFWASRGLNALADDGTADNDLEDFTEITRRINGGTVGLPARLALFKDVEATFA